MMLYSSNEHVIKSKIKSVLAHDVVYWMINDNKFIDSEVSSYSSELREEIINWINKYNEIDKREFIYNLDYVFKTAKVTSILQLKMAQNKNQKNPLKLIIFKCIFFFLIFEFGTSVTINSFLIYTGYSSRFFSLFYQSFWTTLILYIIMLISLYTSKKLFHYLFYLFFVFVTWFYHNTGGFIGLFILNNIIIELPLFLNLLIFICFGTGLSLLCIFTDNFPKFDKIKIKCPKLDGNIAIVHLTDLHLGEAYGRESVELYVKMILSLKNQT